MLFMSATNPFLHQLAKSLPDIPRWVEARSMLLSGQAEIFGFNPAEPLNFVVSDPEVGLVAVVGRPLPQAIQEAVIAYQDEVILLTPPETSSHIAQALPTWTATPAWLHRLGDTPHLPYVSPGAVRLLAPAEIDSLTHLPADLQAELARARQYSPIAATFVGSQPVSFCYIAAQTETLWDISIDTLAEYRGQSYAALSVAFMIDRQRQQGQLPVWGAEETNLSSLRLAAKLGFEPVDQLIVFRPSVPF